MHAIVGFLDFTFSHQIMCSYFRTLLKRVNVAKENPEERTKVIEAYLPIPLQS